MSENTTASPVFIILGASLDTGNLGVSALLAATVKILLQIYEDAQIKLLEGVRNPTPQIVPLQDGSSVLVDRLGIRYNKTVWRKNHIVRLLCSASFARCLPVSLRSRWLHKNAYLRAIVTAKAVMDITGGDSFSDIYGIRRLVLGSLSKLLVLIAGADLILLPQTYGPFKSVLGRSIARTILLRAAAIYSRDQEGLEQIRRLTESRTLRSEPQFCPDVAFLLDPIAPLSIQVQPEPLPLQDSPLLVGFNVSGLLWNGGYTHDNMFELRVDYPELIQSLVQEILQKSNTIVLLIPHVFPHDSWSVESDLQVCLHVFKIFEKQYPHKLFVSDGKYNQSEIKYIIGQCDFFLGSRMHACIAAASQGIPTMPLAYSRKFHGVFDAVGVRESVADLRSSTQEDIKKKLNLLLQCREETRKKLLDGIPRLQESTLQTFSDQLKTL